MIRRSRGTLLVLVLALVGLAVPAAAETLFVRSKGAVLKAEPKGSAAKVKDLSIGTAVSVLGREKSWVKVDVGGSQGWVHKFKLSEDEPDTGDSVLAGLGGSRGDYVAEADSGRGARGLDETAEEYAGREKISPSVISSVKRMEQVKVSDRAIDNFLKAGKLGDYVE